MKRSFFVIALLSVLLGKAHAQSPAELDNLVQASFQNFPKLKEAERLIQSGEMRVDIAKTALLPFVNGNLSYTYLTPVAQAALPTPDGPKTLQFIPHNNYNFNVSAGYALYDFGKTDLSIRQARENVLTQRHSLELTKQNLAYQVAQLYYSIGFLQKSIQVQDDVIATSAKLIEQIAVRYQNGDALEFDIVTQKVRFETAKTRKIDFENQIEKQRIMLAYLTGIPREDLTIAEFSTPETTTMPAPVGSLMTQAEGQNKELLLAQDRIRSAETEIAIAQKAHLPTLLLNASAGVKNGYVPDISILRPNTAAGIAVTIPLYAGKRYDLQRKAAEISRQASDYNLEAVSANLRKDMESVLADRRSNEARLQSLQAQLTQADRALAIAENRLANGTITAVELESAQTGIEEARLGQVNLQYQIFMNGLELQRLAGVEFWK
ncbi:TolC family protein [Persicitalea jodogahamensis]|uniref:Outer membrane protein n=1 Tax=Persicitalea jodogahamensis TaxID=402147 RepID=A0A8J3GAT1_9BACT|nr:TolC family protein [Persicitalea jodogahamensis]GHB85491.1 outer membrane protein [Persicitalea jodogahamensis]